MMFKDDKMMGTKSKSLCAENGNKDKAVASDDLKTGSAHLL